MCPLAGPWPLPLALQVVLTGEALHHVAPTPTPAAAASPAPTAPGARTTIINATPGAGFSIENPGETHPLRPYWEYLCFLFRKLEAVPEHDRVELSYRDYLQAPLQPLQVRTPG